MRLFSRHSADIERPGWEGLPSQACGGEALIGPESQLSGSA